MAGGQAIEFHEIYTKYAPKILAYAIRRSNTEDQAADVVSETFLVAWRKFDQVPRNNEALYWLYGVARKVLASSYRSEARRRRLGESLKQYLANQPDSNEIQLEVIRTRKALSVLNDQERELICLAAWEGLNSTEIAAILEMKPNTVRTQLARARKKLKVKLEEGGVS